MFEALQAVGISAKISMAMVTFHSAEFIVGRTMFVRVLILAGRYIFLQAFVYSTSSIPAKLLSLSPLLRVR